MPCPIQFHVAGGWFREPIADETLVDLGEVDF